MVDWSARRLGQVETWSLRLRIFLFFAMLAVGGVVIVSAAAWFGFRRLDPAAPVGAFVLVAILASFALLALSVWVWLLFDENVAKPVIALASDLRARTHAEVGADLDARAGRYLGDLAPAAAAVSSRLAKTRDELKAAAERERLRVFRERARLEAILRDAPTAIFLCSDDHRIALYNNAAVDQFRDVADVGLGRSVFDFLQEGPIRDALERADDAAADCLCASLDGEKTFQARLRRVALAPEAQDVSGESAVGSDERPGYALTLRDVTEETADNAARAALLDTVFDAVARPAANLQSSVDALRAPETSGHADRTRLQANVISEIGKLTEALNGVRAQRAALSTEPGLMTEKPLAEILGAVARRLESAGRRLVVESAPSSIRCESFALARALGDVALAATDIEGEARDLRLTATVEGAEAMVDVSWSGPVFSMAALDAALDAPLSGGGPPTTPRAVLERHDADIWPEFAQPDRARLRAPFPVVATARPELGRRSDRAVFHDFELLSARALSAEEDERALKSVDFVVFDTETTGLEPNAGDEIVQIAAVRIVNGRVLPDDRFETLVDPERSIPASSTAIHGVSEAMVAGAPTIDVAGRAFHRFCRGAVLIAHNARFDMSFLRRHEPRIGARFDHLVLDTVLMSAALFGRTVDHALDGVVERLSVPLPEEVRHTALGDALATAEAAAKMMAMLEGRGVDTLGELKRALATHEDMLAGAG